MEGKESFATVKCRGELLHTRCWQISTLRKPRSILFICHGLGEHSGSYDRLVDIFVSKEIAVYSHDHYGHGRSPGVPGLILDMKDITNPILSHVTQLRDANPGVPIFLLGHSMGGLAAVMCAREDKSGLFRGVLLVSPALGIDPAFVQGWKVALGGCIACLCPQMLIPSSELKIEYLTADEVMREAVRGDSLQFLVGIRCATGFVINQAINFLANYRAEFPFHLMHSRADKLTYYDGSEKFFQRACSDDKEFLGFESLGHQLHYELEPHRTQVRDAMTNWILSRC